jgi:NAD(P)H-dependent flavin oxidoreductase YrpB (nitropropane dioxygenase family)
MLTRFTSLIGCTAPIQQAGMGGVAAAGLAAAVAQAGGLGMIGAVRVPAKFLGQILERMGEIARQSVGVNFLVPFLDKESVEAAAAKARVVEFFYGDPDRKLVDVVHKGGALAAWQIGSVEEAQQAIDAGCDFIVAQGTEAGGHVRGRIGLLALLDQVLDKTELPVVAAGGIGTARSMAAAIVAGAEAVRVGTRFVACTESLAHPRYKELLVHAKAEDTVLTKAFSANWPNAPHRVLRSCVTAAQAITTPNVGEMQVMGGEKVPVQRMSTPCPIRSTTGNIEAMALYAGESVGAVKAIQPAADIVRELVEGAESLLRLWSEVPTA